MIRLRDGSTIDPEQTSSGDEAYLAEDGMVFLSERGELRALASAGAEVDSESEQAVAELLRELSGEQAGRVKQWAVKLIRKMGEWALGTAHYDGPWSYGYWGPVPRRALSDKANFLVGEGMYPSWQDWYLEKGVLPRLDLVRQAFPKELARTLDPPVRQILTLLLRRSGWRCGEGAMGDLDAARPGFPTSITALHPAVSRSSDWLVHRLLNGMLPAYLRRVPDDPSAFDVVFSWDERRFRDKARYSLPSVRARLVVAGDRAGLRHIDYRYARHEPYVRVVMDGPGAAPAWLQQRALRGFRCSYLMAAEIDRHIVLGHLVTEFVLVGLHVCLSSEHPIYRLLVPFLQYVDVANHIGDKLVWGDSGVMVMGSPFSAEGLAQAFGERMGAFDWKGFAPHQKSLVEAHYAPAVQEAFWKVLRQYVSDAFATLGVSRIFPETDSSASAEEKEACKALWRLSEELVQRSVDACPYDGLVEDDLFDASELSFRCEGKAFSPIRTLSDLEQFCCFVVYCATLGHGWANVRQYEEGGELEYASFGLSLPIDAPPPKDGDDDRHWQVMAAPSACDLANQALQGYVLSYLPVANLVEEIDGPRKGDPLLADVLVGAASLGARTQKLAGRIREIAARNPTGVMDQACDAAWIPARPNA